MSPPRSSAYSSVREVCVLGGVSAVAWGLLAWRSYLPAEQLGWMLATTGLAWLALIGLLSRKDRFPSGPVIAFGLGFRVIALVATPVMEDDYQRFLWDGFRFAGTGDPYAEAPQARFADDRIPTEFRAVLDNINHPDVPTVYGPGTQWAFRLSYLIAPAQLWPWKLILLAVELAIGALLWPELSGRGRLLLAWCPLAVFETGFNAHPDVLAIGLVVAAWWLGRRSLTLAAGAAAGLAVATKVFAVLLLPFLLWRRGLRAWSMAAAAVLLLYAPFWLRGSAADFAGLKAMAGQWEFNSSIFALVTMALPRPAAQTVCLIVFGVIWCAVWIRWARTNALPPNLPPGEWVYGPFLFLSATANPWYFLWLWPFVAVRVSVVGVGTLAAVSLAYVTGLNLGAPGLGNFEHPLWLRPLEFGLIGLCALAGLGAKKPRLRAKLARAGADHV